MTLTIGVLGAGRIGKLHIENVLQNIPSFHLKTIADPLYNAATALYKGINHTHNPEEIMDDPDITAVLICTPSTLHAEQIIQCARAGKHIFCEKPIAMNLPEIALVLQAVEKAGVKLQIGFNRRFDPNFAKIKTMLKNGAIGQPHLLHITSRDPKIPPAEFIKTSCGLFLDMTIHDFDMARYLINSEIQALYVNAEVLIDPIFKQYDDVDTAIINIKFANGCLGVIDNSRQAVYGYDQRIEVFGDQGLVQAENNKPTNTTWSTQDGIMTEKPLYYFLERYQESFIAELQAFYQCIVDNTQPLVSGTDGLMAVMVALAAQQSLKENRPIKIDYRHADASHLAAVV